MSLYIHYNPVKAGIVKNPEEWKYSNYSDAIMKRNGTLFNNDILHYSDILPKEYKELMNNYHKSEIEKEINEYIF